MIQCKHVASHFLTSRVRAPSMAKFVSLTESSWACRFFPSRLSRLRAPTGAYIAVSVLNKSLKQKISLTLLCSHNGVKQASEIYNLIHSFTFTCTQERVYLGCLCQPALQIMLVDVSKVNRLIRTE